MINHGTRRVQAVAGSWLTEEQREYTAYTDTISGTSGLAYKLPENFKSLVELYVTVGSTQYPAELIQDIDLWRQINSTTTSSTSAYLQFVFIKNDRFEIYPIPSSSDTNTMTLRYRIVQKNMVNADYTTGTITTLANEGTAVTGSSTSWTSAMTGRYFRIDDDGEWYKINTVGSTTSITLDSEYQGVAISAGTEAYTIGEMAVLPDGYYELPVFYAVWKWALFRKDTQLAREYERMWKEGLQEIASTYNNRSASAIIRDKSRLGRRGFVNPNWYPEGMS